MRYPACVAVLNGVRAQRMRQEPGATAGANDVVVVLTAVAAEPDGHEEPARAGERLAFQRKLAGGGGFNGGENGPALAYELVKLEGEGSSTIVASEVAATR